MDRSEYELYADKCEELASEYHNPSVQWLLNQVVFYDEKKESYVLWELTRRGVCDVWNMPKLWKALAREDGRKAASTLEIVDFLSKIEHFDLSYERAEARGRAGEHGRSQRLAQFWPLHLDTLAMWAYAQDADLVESRAADFHPIMQKGMQLVRRRFGVIERDKLPEETMSALATIYINSGWGILYRSVWDMIDGEMTRLDLGNPADRHIFLANFNDGQVWENLVLDAAFEGNELRKHLDFGATRESWPIANLEQIERFLAGLNIYKGYYDKVIDTLLSRDDAPKELLRIAQKLADDGRAAEAQLAAISAVLRAKALGETPPNEALTHFDFALINTGLPALLDALSAFGEDQAIPLLIEAFEDERIRYHAFSALKAYPGNTALLDKAFQAVEGIGKDADYATLSPVVSGLAELGPDILGPLSKAYSETRKPVAKNTYHRAILEILEQAGEAQDPKFDKFISLVSFKTGRDLDDDELRNHCRSKYRMALRQLPEDRAVKLVLKDLKKKNKWYRALAALWALPRPELYECAFARICEKDSLIRKHSSWFDELVAGLREEDFRHVGAAIAAHDSPTLIEYLRSSVSRGHLRRGDLVKNGEELFERYLQSIGVAPEVAVEPGPFDHIHRLVESILEEEPDLEMTTIYALTPGDAPPDPGTLNRIGGRPFGVTRETWPLVNDDADQPLEHLFTLDLDTMPAMREQCDGARALALFMRTPQLARKELLAFEAPHDANIRVLLLGHDDIAEFEGDLPTGEDNVRGFSVHEIEVPEEAADVMGWEDEEDGGMDDLIGHIKFDLVARVGGEPGWLQSEWYEEPNFVMEFDDSFCNTMMDDGGVMYVFSDTAFWQCT